MKNISTYLVEKLRPSGLSKEGLEKFKSFLGKLLDELNSAKLKTDSNWSRKRRMKGNPGQFFVRFAESGLNYSLNDVGKFNEIENSKANGTYDSIQCMFEVNDKADLCINKYALFTCLNNAFNIDLRDINESILDSDKDIKKEFGDIYDYVKNLHDVLVKTFKTDKFPLYDTTWEPKVKAGDMCNNKYPTIYVDNLGIQLRGISISNISDVTIKITLIAFESKSDDTKQIEKDERAQKRQETQSRRDPNFVGGEGSIRNKDYNNIARICNFLKERKPLFITRVMGGKYFKCSGWHEPTREAAEKFAAKIKKNLNIECKIKLMSNSNYYYTDEAYFILVPVATDDKILRYEYGV